MPDQGPRLAEAGGGGRTLAGTVASLRRLAQAVPPPVRLRIECDGYPAGQLHPALKVAFAQMGVSGVDLAAGPMTALSSFEALMSRRITGALRDADPAEVGRLVRDLPGAETAPLCVPLPVGRGLVLSACQAGLPGSPAVLIVPPCGMPVELCSPWIQALALRHHVVTFESRGMFGTCDAFDELPVRPVDQVEDMLAVLDRFGIDSAHVVGICGGAVTALLAAEAHPDRVRSVAACYGDYNFGSEQLRTGHQKNFTWVMKQASASRAEARDLQTMFTRQKALATVPDVVAHYALLPYANSELFYRYGKLNAAANGVDIRPVLERIEVPVLVVTGDADDTTHPEGSKEVCRRLRHARLHTETGGTHVAFFQAAPSSLALLESFFDGEGGNPTTSPAEA